MKLDHNEIMTALIRLDEEALRAHLLSCGIAPPDDPTAFWIAIHRSRAQMPDVPEAFRDESENWLKVLGLEVWAEDPVIDVRKIFAV